QIVEGGADARQVVARLRGQGQRAVLPDEQADAQLLLQPPDLMADRGLRHVQLGGRLGEAQMPGGGLERPQTVERRQPGGHFQCPAWYSNLMTLSHLKRHNMSFAELPKMADICG